MIDIKNKVVYLSGGITGVDGYREAFARAEAACRELGARVVLNPALMPEGWDYGHYMAADLALVRVAHVVVHLPGWGESKGALTEHAEATALGIPCHELDEVVPWTCSACGEAQPGAFSWCRDCADRRVGA